MEQVEFRRTPQGVALTRQALGPKLRGGWHTMWWTGPDPAHPGAAIWTTDETAAATFPDEAAAVDALAALGSRLYPPDRLPAPQIELAVAAAGDEHEERVTLEKCVCGEHLECPDGWHWAPESDEPGGAWCGCTPDCALDEDDDGDG